MITSSRDMENDSKPVVKFDPALPTLDVGDRMAVNTTPPKGTLAARIYNGKLRKEVFSHYCGGTPQCQCPDCKTTFIEFLTLDHMSGDGAAHRKANALGTGGPRLWRWVRANGYPPGFQVLCQNCNHAKFTRAVCPMAGQPH